ncbi:MAG: YcxB family protein [Luteolibacter sp.]
MEPITARFRLTADDLIAGRKYAKTASPNWWITINKYVSVTYLAFVATLFLPDGFRLSDYLTAEIIRVILLTILVVDAIAETTFTSKIRRGFAKRADANQMEIAWTVSETDIHVSSPHSNTEFVWPAFQRIVSTADGFIFMTTEQNFYFLPTRAFSSPADIENFKVLARGHATEFK